MPGGSCRGVAVLPDQVRSLREGVCRSRSRQLFSCSDNATALQGVIVVGAFREGLLHWMRSSDGAWLGSVPAPFVTEVNSGYNLRPRDSPPDLCASPLRLSLILPLAQCTL